MLFAAVSFAQKDVTSQYITNAKFNNGTTGWTVINRENGPAQGNNTAGYAMEFYAGWGGLSTTSYSATQSITLPAGHYTLVNYSFFRQGEFYNTNSNKSLAFLKAGDNQVAIKTLASINENNTFAVGGYANSMIEGANVFDSKMYRNAVDFTIDADNTQIEIGVEGTFDEARSWCILGMFELINKDLPATMDSPFDVTGYITNPGFEYRNMTGWTLSENNTLKAADGNDLQHQFKVGGWFAEQWQGSGALTERNISQTLTSLPAGYYKLTANLGGNGTYIDLNGKTANWTADKDYTVGYVLAENENLTITAGKTAEGTANWIHFDNFRLQFCGDVAAALTTLLNKVTEYADQLPTDIYAQLQTNVAAYNQTYTDVDDLLTAIAALDALYDEADNYSANFNAAYDLLETALLRFETDYNQIIADGTDYGRRNMSQKAWTDLLEKVNDVTAAMDESYDYSSFATTAQALNDQLDATDASIKLWGGYQALIEGNTALGLDASACTADTYTATDAALQTACAALSDQFAAYAATQNQNFDVSAFLGANLDGSSEPGAVFDDNFPNLQHIDGWKVNYSGLTEGSSWVRVTKNTEDADHPNNLYLRKAWYSSVVTLQILKERMLPAGNYTLTYKISTNSANITNDLSYYSIDGTQTSLVNTSQAWTDVTKDFTISDAYAPFDLSFGFETNANSGSDNAPQIMVTDIVLTYNAVSQFQIALNAAREYASSIAAASAIDQWEDYEGHEEDFSSATERQRAINILNNAVTIAQNNGSATSLIANVDFTGGTTNLGVQGSGGQTIVPAEWTFYRDFEGWNDTKVENGYFNAWAGVIKLAELYQTLSDMPNGQYRLTANVMTDVNDGSSALAIYGNPQGGNVGRSPEVTGEKDIFSNYSVDFQVAENQFSIGIRSDKAYYKVKDFTLTFVETKNATAQAAMIQQDYFWNRGDTDVDLTDSKYAEAVGAVLYPQYVNQVIRVSNAQAIASPTKNIVANGTCQNFEIIDGQPLTIRGGSFTATTATYTRTMGNTYGTLILPYEANANSDVQFFHLSNVLGDTSQEEGVLQFSAASHIDANTPILVKKVNSEATDISIIESNVTVENTTAEQNDETTTSGWSAEGYYSEQQFTEYSGLFYIASNQFWAATGTLTVKPFRAIYIYAGDTPANVLKISIDDTPNAIMDIGTEGATPNGIYTISGQLVRQNSDIRDLAPGLYIINGKKTLIK